MPAPGTELPSVREHPDAPARAGGRDLAGTDDCGGLAGPHAADLPACESVRHLPPGHDDPAGPGTVSGLSRVHQEGGRDPAPSCLALLRAGAASLTEALGRSISFQRADQRFQTVGMLLAYTPVSLKDQRVSLFTNWLWSLIHTKAELTL